MEGADNITQLQNQVYLLSSQFADHAGYFQQFAPPLGPPLKPQASEIEAKAEQSKKEFLTKRSQGITEIMQTVNNVQQVRCAMFMVVL